MKVGVTGHQYLSQPQKWGRVEEAIKHVLDQSTNSLIGISCLAIGADQLFSRIVLERRGSLDVILPFADIERTFVSDADRNAFRNLLAQASRVEILERHLSDEIAFLTAGQRVVDLSDLVIAVWNGKPAGGIGGTADIVEYARQLGRPVEHINPDTL